MYTFIVGFYCDFFTWAAVLVGLWRRCGTRHRNTVGSLLHCFSYSVSRVGRRKNSRRFRAGFFFFLIPPFAPFELISRVFTALSRLLYLPLLLFFSGIILRLSTDRLSRVCRTVEGGVGGGASVVTEVRWTFPQCAGLTDDKHDNDNNNSCTIKSNNNSDWCRPFFATTTTEETSWQFWFYFFSSSPSPPPRTHTRTIILFFFFPMLVCASVGVFRPLTPSSADASHYTHSPPPAALRVRLPRFDPKAAAATAALDPSTP